MNSLLEWLAMGGYSCYVWSAYGVVMGFFVLNIFSIRLQKKRTRQKLQHWYKR
ncbi:MAG: heme exporter protein CcmD [bacterium]|nr:heme exporter protein CcmD [bacterium]